MSACGREGERNGGGLPFDGTIGRQTRAPHLYLPANIGPDEPSNHQYPLGQNVQQGLILHWGGFYTAVGFPDAKPGDSAATEFRRERAAERGWRGRVRALAQGEGERKHGEEKGGDLEKRREGKGKGKRAGGRGIIQP